MPVFMIMAEITGGERHIIQHQSSGKTLLEETINTDRRIREYGNMSPAKKPPSNFHSC
jgi:hypothetical protein